MDRAGPRQAELSAGPGCGAGGEPPAIPDGATPGPDLRFGFPEQVAGSAFRSRLLVQVAGSGCWIAFLDLAPGAGRLCPPHPF